MKRIASVALAAAVLLALPLAHVALAHSDSSRPWNVCHKGQTMLIARAGAINGHLKHGDCTWYQILISGDPDAFYDRAAGICQCPS